jgi:ATP-dependent RNA helicase RhlE
VFRYFLLRSSMPFNELGLIDQLVQGILATGYTTPTLIQSQVIPQAIAGHDIIGCAQTGTGKTAAFVLPILQHLSMNKGQHKGRPIRSLVLVPTRELAQQVDEFIKMYGRFSTLQSTALYGGVSIENQKRHLRNGVDIVAATPGRLLDHLQQRTADLSHVEILVIDEADRMFDMGFINDVRKIIGHIPAQRQTMLFSATMSKEVKGLTAALLKNPKTVEIGEQRKPADSVKQHFFSVPQPKKLDLLLHILHTEQLDCVLVFSRTKHGADRISRRLERGGVKATAIHSDRTQAQRQHALAGFKRGQYQVLVATDIAARGIDVEGISHVINFDTPAFAEDYVHRIGRTGRASALGDAYTFVSGEEKNNIRGIERYVGKRFEIKEYKGFDYSAQPTQPKPSEHPQGGHPQGGHPQGGHPQGERPQGERPRSEHSRNEHSRSEHSRSERPRNDRTRDDHRRNERGRDDRPRDGQRQSRSERPQFRKPLQDSNRSAQSEHAEHAAPADRKEPHSGRPESRPQQTPRPQRSSSRPENRTSDQRGGNRTGGYRTGDNRTGGNRRDDRTKRKEPSTPLNDYPNSEKDWQKVVEEIEQHGGLTKKLRRWFKKD